MKLTAAITRYLSALESWGRRPSTMTSYRGALGQLAAWLAEREVADVERVTPDHLRAFSADLARYRYRRSHAQGAPLKALALTTRYNRLDHVRHLFAWLVRDGLTLTDAVAGLPLGRCKRPLPSNVLSEGEAARLLAAPDPTSFLGIRDRAVLELLYSSGLRVAELSALDLTDVDLAAGLVLVRRGKGEKSRVVPLGQRAADSIALYLRQVRPRFLTRPGVTALFVGSQSLGHGKRLRPGGIQDRIHLAAQTAGIERQVTAHTLRHSLATHLLRAGAGIRHVQEILGHSRIDTTEIYTHVAITDLAAVHARSHPRGRARRDDLLAPVPNPRR